METGGSRRRRTLSDENLDSPNLRDFLRVKEEDNNNSLSGLTLRAVLSSGKRSPTPVHVNRTLLDVIKDDPNYGKESKKSWKALKSRLRLRRAGAAWTSSVITPASDVPMAPNPNRTISRRLSTRFGSDGAGAGSEPAQPVPEPSQVNPAPSGGGSRGAMMRRNSSRVPSLAATGYGRTLEGSGSSLGSTGDRGSGCDHTSTNAHDDGEDRQGEEVEEGVGETEGEEGEGEGGGEPRMSLMALLAETDRQMGLDGSTYITGDTDEEEEEEEEVVVASGGGGGVEYNNCCVCMVRHKGAAFIPCGHTFCRLCSRELWVQRGNCPICNGFILEILDIF